MKRPPYTPVKLYTDGLHGIAAGDYITTSGGSAYLVQQVRQSPTIRARRYLACLRWPIDEIPAGARFFEIHWYSRSRKRLAPRPRLETMIQ